MISINEQNFNILNKNSVKIKVAIYNINEIFTIYQMSINIWENRIIVAIYLILTFNI